MSKKLIEFDKAEMLLKEKNKRKEQDTMKNREILMDRILEETIKEASVKARLAEAVITNYKKALNGERDIEPLQDHLAEFMSLPISAILSSNRVSIPILVDNVNGTEYIAGITRTAEDTDTDPTKKEGFQYKPLIMRARKDGTWERQTGDGKWIKSKQIIPEITKEQERILEKNDAEAELMRLMINSAGDMIAQEEITQNFNDIKGLARLRSLLQGMTSFDVLPNKKFAIVPMDYFHTGIAITFTNGKYEIRQCIAGEYRKALDLDSIVDQSLFEYAPVVATTQKAETAEKIMLTHITLRKGCGSAITIPLSANRQVCATGKTTEEILSSFLEQTKNNRGFTAKEKSNAEMFAVFLAKI